MSPAGQQPHSQKIRHLFGDLDIYLFDQLHRGRFDGCASVLDAGCGGGRNLTWFLRAGIETFGVDRDRDAIDRVRAMASRLTGDSREDHFRVAEIDDLPWPDLQVDGVICSAVLHFASGEEHFARMMESMWKVLRPGGIFFARLASRIGLEAPVTMDRNRRALLPDGSTRFLVDEDFLLAWRERLGASLLDPIKTTNVQNQRCMTTWVLRSH